MKKLIILISSTLLALTIGVSNVSAQTPTVAGLYCTSNPEYATNGYNLDENINLMAGFYNDIIFLYYDGNGNYTNVSADVVIPESSLFNKEVIDMRYGEGDPQPTQKAVRFSVKVIGTCPETYSISYTDSQTTYKITDIKTSYCDFFAIEKGVDPTKNIDKIVGDINTSINATSYYDLYYLVSDVPTKYDSSQQFSLYKHGDELVESDIATLTYDTEQSSFKITGVKEGNCFICPSGNTFQRLSLNINGYPEFPVTIEQGIVPNEFGPISSFDFTYKSNDYKIGLGNDSGSDTLHIDSGSIINLTNENPCCGAELLIGKKQIQNPDEYLPAEAEVYGLFSDVQFKVVAENTAGFTAVKTKKRCLGVVADSIRVSDSADEVTKAMIEVSFTYNSQQHTINYGIIVNKTENFEINNISVENFVDANFDDKESLEALIHQQITNPSNTIVTINLDSTKTYNGINIAYGKELYGLIINGKDAILKGTLSSENAITEVYNINFDNTGGSENAKALASINSTSGPSQRGSISRVEDCTFTNYKYGVYCEGNTLISGVQRCNFENCGTGIYIDSYGGDSYSDYKNDEFFNCDTAIDLVQIPSIYVPYQFVMKSMSFISKDPSNCIDYNVHCKGNFFFTGNYYGKYDAATYPNPQPENIEFRSANVKYTVEDKTKTKIYTNPCIRYGDDGLGIDPKQGLYTAIFFSNSGLDNFIPTDDLNKDIKLDLCENGSGKQLASLKFKEAN